MCMKAQIEKCICVRRFWIEENCHGSGAVTHSTHWVVASSRGQDPIPRRVQWWTETYPPGVQLGAIDRAAFLAFEAPWIGHASDAANSGTTTLDSVFGLGFLAVHFKHFLDHSFTWLCDSAAVIGKWFTDVCLCNPWFKLSVCNGNRSSWSSSRH